MDQAQTLREMVKKNKRRKDASPFIMTVTSGKGGVGKTNVVANLSHSLALLGRKVMVMDADMGLGNIDLLLGLVTKYTIEHVISGEKLLQDVVVESPGGVLILPASSGIEELTSLEPLQKMNLTAQLEELLDLVDILLIDTSAGISSNVMYFNSLAQEILVVVSPEPTSLTDAYALMKVHSQRHAGKRYKILCNAVKGEREAMEIFKRLSMVTQRFLNISLDPYGYIPNDEHVPMAVRQQKLLIETYPHCEAAQKFHILAKKIDEKLFQSQDNAGMKTLRRNFFSIMEMGQ